MNSDTYLMMSGVAFIGSIVVFLVTVIWIVFFAHRRDQ
jgi:hypothetical protein